MWKTIELKNYLTLMNEKTNKQNFSSNIIIITFLKTKINKLSELLFNNLIQRHIFERVDFNIKTIKRKYKLESTTSNSN